MTLLLGLGLALLLSYGGAAVIKKRPVPFYITSLFLAAAVIFVTWSGIDARFPSWLSNILWPLLSRGALATSLFIVVMGMGALPRGCAPLKRLMPIRAELSIMASLLILGHNIAYGKTYFVRLFTDAGRMALTQRLAAICSLIMIAIMLPLMITSFKPIRRKMKPKAWKRLQRTAYLFYALIYVHVMLLYVPLAQSSQRFSYRINIILYSVIFIGYACLRLDKALSKRGHATCLLKAVSAGLCICICAAGCIPWKALLSKDEPADAPLDAIAYTDGTYFGVGEGYLGEMTVAVRIENGAIARVTVIESQDDAAYWNKALGVVDEVIASQSTAVDAVSGATYSSKGLLAAIDDALSKAVTAP